jgi:hypothetical protein
LATERTRRPLIAGDDARIRIEGCPPGTRAALFIGDRPMQEVRVEDGTCTLDPLTFGGRLPRPVQKMPRDLYRVDVLTGWGGWHCTIERVPPGYTHRWTRTLKTGIWLRYFWRRRVQRMAHP